MQAARLGIINFLGIFIPGSYVAGILFLAAVSILRLQCDVGFPQACKLISENVVLTSVVFFFVSFLLGVLVRLFATRNVDRMSRFYFTVIRRKKGDDDTENFPYKESIKGRLTRHGMKKVHVFIESLNKEWGRENNTTFFNFCKWFIDANSPALSKQVQQSEAFIRFLSGTALALLLTFMVSVIMFVIFFNKDIPKYYWTYISLLALALFCLVPILERYKLQRRREVFMVWSSVYIILNGGILEYDKNGTGNLTEKLFFRTPSAPGGAGSAKPSAPAAPAGSTGAEKPEGSNDS